MRVRFPSLRSPLVIPLTSFSPAKSTSYRQPWRNDRIDTKAILSFQGGLAKRASASESLLQCNQPRLTE